MVLDYFKDNCSFYLDDLDKIGAYVNKYCDKDVINKIILRADESVNKKFVFDLRWDMEYTLIPVEFKDKIDWAAQPFDDPEWTFAFNRNTYWLTMGKAYVMTKDEKYAKAFVEQLVDWIDTVKIDDEKYANCWRTLEAGIRMDIWIRAIYMFKDSSYLTDEVMDKFVKSIHEHQKFIFNSVGSTKLISNWGVMENHGLFVSTLLLKDDENSKLYFETAYNRLLEQMQMQVYPDGVQWEQSTMYHNEVTRDFVDVKILSDRNGFKLPDWFNEKLHKMLEFTMHHKKPNGNQILMGDTDEIDVRDIVAKAAVLYNDGYFKYCSYPRFDLETIFDMGYEASQKYDKLKALKPEENVKVFKESGNIFTHSTYNEDETYLHFYNGVHGGGHAHADKLHIDLSYNGDDILTDSGRYTYVNKKERFEFKDAIAHNSIIVDNDEYIHTKSSWAYTKRSLSVNNKIVEKNNYTLIEGGHLGYLNEHGVYVNRKVIKIENDIIIVVDEIYGHGKHDIAQYWHLENKGAISKDDNDYEYITDNSVVEILNDQKASSSLIETSISRHYNVREKNQSIKNETKMEDFTSLWTFISLNKKDNIEPITVEKTSVHYSSRPDKEMSDSVFEAYIIKKGNREYSVLVAHEDYMGPSDTVKFNNHQSIGHVVIFSNQDDEKYGTCLDY